MTSGSVVGVISFSNSPVHLSSLTGNYSSVKSDIDTITAGANANIAAALQLATTQLTGTTITNKWIILVSDGTPTQPGGVNAALAAAT